VKEGDSDTNAVKAVLVATGFEQPEITRVRRIGKMIATNEQRPRTVVVELGQYQHVGIVIANRIKLKRKAEYSDVYINRDVSDNVRLLEYELRKRRNSMNAALSEVGQDGRRFAIDKSGRKWYWGNRWGEIH
jgi:hypothetical protein